MPIYTTEGSLWYDITQQPDFHNLYTSAINFGKLWEYIEARDDPVKVLDIGGGTGTLGLMLQEEFGHFVDYVNVDGNRLTLEESPGRKVHGSYTRLPELLGDEKFDYIFCLNSDDYTNMSGALEAMRRDKQDYLAQMVSSSVNNSRRLNAYLLLLNAALYVSDDGIIIRGGIIPKDSMMGTKKVLENQGFLAYDEQHLDMSKETARMLAGFDLYMANIGDLPPNEVERIALTYAQNFRLTTFQRKNPSNRKGLRREIDECSEKLGKIYSELEAQERFWG